MEQLLTIGEVAGELRISDTAVYRLIADGRMPHVRVGTRRYLITRDQLNSFIDDNSIDHRDAG